MERFCDRCGSLVSGNVKHCTFCGAEMDKKLFVSSSLDVDTDSIFDNDALENSADITEAAAQSGSVRNTARAVHSNPQNSADDCSAVPQADQGRYIPLYKPNNTVQESNEYTTTRWLGTLVVSMCFGIVSDIILIIWARDDSNMMRRNFARAMLIIAPIVHFGFFLVLLVAAAFILA